MGLLRRKPRSTLDRILAGQAPAREALTSALLRGDTGALLTWHKDGEPVHTSGRAAYLVLGGPGAGKTTHLLIPAVLAHPAPVVSASTKHDVLQATANARGQIGRVLAFAPGAGQLGGGVIEARWSPLASAGDYEQAMRTAQAMVGAHVAGRQGGEHFASRAQQLLGCLFHAAAVAGASMPTLVGWVMAGDLAPGLAELEEQAPQSIALATLRGLDAIPDRERGSIVSTAADTLRAYQFSGALELARAPAPGENAAWLDPDAFAASAADTLYLVAPSHDQRLLAPVIVGVLTDLRHAAYRLSGELVRAGRGERRDPPILWALDEMANIAPVPDMMSILSEAGGQGLQVLGVLQDLSQARERWGPAADGLLSLVGTTAVMASVRDRNTLENLSAIIGDYDRPIATHSSSTTRGSSRAEGIHGLFEPRTLSDSRTAGESWTTRRERAVPPSRSRPSRPARRWS
jgi:type IV secretory pathway TraG/TraD family ATPase VirD4